MEAEDFNDRARDLKGSKLHIEIDWNGKMGARRLKGFVDQDPKNRAVKIRATHKQWMEEQNVFGSGVEWVEVKDEE